MHESPPSTLHDGAQRTDPPGTGRVEGCPGPVVLGDDAGLEWRPLDFDALAEVSGLLTAIEHYDEPGDRHTVEQLQDAYRGANRPPGESALLGRLPGGQVVAYGWNYVEPDDISPRRVYLTGGVHPGFRGQGIGRTLLAWQMDRARAYDAETRQPEFGPLRQICFVDDHLVDRRNLLHAAGFTPVRWSVDMTMVFGPELTDHAWPSGVELLPYDPSMSEQVRQCHNRCFAEKPMAQPVPQDVWDRSVRRSTFHPEWSWVARDVATDALIGYAMNSGYESDWTEQGHSEGWTDRLGVLPEHRGRGIAGALLQSSILSFRRAGLEGAGLGVDLFHPTTGRGVYERVGYHASRTTIMYVHTDD